MFGCTQHQPYGLSQAISTLPYPYGLSVTSHTARISRYAHTHTGLACKVQGLHNAASTTAHSHCLAFTCNSLHRAKRTHRGPDFQKRCCCWQFSLKNQTYFQKRPTEKIFGQTTFNKTAKKAKRPTNLKFGQISEIWPQNGQSGNPAVDCTSATPYNCDATIKFFFIAMMAVDTLYDNKTWGHRSVRFHFGEAKLITFWLS